MHALLHFCFSHFTSYFLIFFLFVYPLCFSLLSISLFFLCFLLFFLVLPLLLIMHNQGLFILLAMIRFTILPLNCFQPIVGVLPRSPTGLLAAQPPPLPCAGCAMFHFQTKGVLFYLLVFRSIPIQIRVWVFSLTNSCGMHLVILAHLSLFWVECHLSKTSPPKVLERESQNRLTPSSYRQTIPYFTSDPWPTDPVLVGYKWVVPGPYVRSTPI